MIRVATAVSALQTGGSPQTVPSRENPTDVATRIRARELHQRMDGESPFAELEWRAVGPQKQGGQVESITVPAGETSTFDGGLGSGNLWNTVNKGTTWTPIFEKESMFAIGDVAVAESDPNVVWAGTGEVLMARSSYAGTGVFKFLDAGVTCSSPWPTCGVSRPRPSPRGFEFARRSVRPELLHPQIVPAHKPVFVPLFEERRGQNHSRLSPSPPSSTH